MWLIQANNLTLHEFNVENAPPYAILSHTWEDEEVSFGQFQDGTGRKLRGWQKIEECCQSALRDGFGYTWVDTCCIDKSNSSELLEAINSMWKWYARSRVCYAYLCDVRASPADNAKLKEEFVASRWFTRGWTLQELLAPNNVVFVGRDWKHVLGTKQNLTHEISQATGILEKDFQYPLNACAAKKMSWASQRKTTREEDMAYCLLGLFEVNMPLLYGEGHRAFRRLQLQIIQNTDDESVFAWFSGDSTSPFLARSPKDFAQSGDVKRWKILARNSYWITNKGLQIDLRLYDEINELGQKVHIAPLNCINGSSQKPLGLILASTATDGYHYYVLPSNATRAPRRILDKFGIRICDPRKAAPHTGENYYIRM